ncbi:fibronectin type-III domain-containing protein 3A [Parasteatoda tepidariorum]|uniref:fibronectin type-III domain-containing protein 3A n=1 Tax=Parasteatoda tepidariorum TaxID=114398 RepID=UPI00077FD68E|nr:fibronectin type-III domain-containing protein 3A [Parasteatoda tepidariorum]XP_015927183.1 fibronectin type-III domain-containing protein 3A [Parasteatoda tepidariorum]XP_042898934.1 fibronectin type-III domain-containing protein 3A [Parasteatoda tepidariorum]
MASSTDISAGTLNLDNKEQDSVSGSCEETKCDEIISAPKEENKSESSCEKKTVEKGEASSSKTSSSSVDTLNENSSRQNSNFQAFDDKRVNGVKHLNNEPRINVLGNSLPFTPETWTVTSDSQIWFECNKYNNNLRACGGNVRGFQPHVSKLGSDQISCNNIFPNLPSTSSCPQIPHNGSPNSMNYNRNSQYVVHLHVNPGETISFDMGDHVQLIQGPATVRMVSSNNTPPVPMPVQVPPGHMVQQIVDEHGTLRHIILSPQPPVAVTVGNPYNGSASGSITSPVSGTAPFYLYHHPSYSIPPQFPPHIQPGLRAQGMHASLEPLQLHQTNGHSPGMADSSSHLNSFKDERTQRQFFKLKKRLEARQKDGSTTSSSSNFETSAKSYEDTSQNDIASKTPSEKDLLLMKVLSAVQVPSASDITPTSALLEWANLNLNSEENDCDIQLSEISYNLLLLDKSKDAKPKISYSGIETKFLLNELKPATSYSVQIQACYHNTFGNLSESITFKTLSCEPEAPQPPKLLSRTKTTISLKWNAAVDNGAKISSYLLEYDEGSGTDNFVELFSGLQKQYKAVKLKESTCYRFRLVAVNEHGKSGYSSISCFSTCGSTPSQPAPPVLKEAFVTKLCLEWEQRPNDDNYTLQMEDMRTLHGFLPVYNGKETSYTCTRLTHNTTYKFRLCASNDEGLSPWSQVVSYSTLPDKPGKPGKPNVKGRSHSTFFKLVWDPPKEDGGCPITEYKLEMDSGNGFCEIYCGEELEYTCENLQPGKSYSFRVSCQSLGGTSDFSEIGIGVTCPVVPGKCQAPKLCGKPKASSLHVKWVSPEYDGGSEMTEFEVEITNPDNSARIAYKGVGTDCVVAGLFPGRLYGFKVRAYNKVGAGPWSDVFEVTSGAGSPDAPQNIQITPRSAHVVFISWTEPANNGAIITEYRLECRCNEKDFDMVYSGPQCNTEVKSLIPATLYHFQVQAVNSAGVGPFSDVISCQTLPSSPGVISTATIKISVAASSISLSWKEPNNHGSPILSYNVEVGDVLYTTEGDKSEICIEGLVPETQYKVRVQAINSVGPGPFSSPMKIVTRGLPPLPPLLECSGCSHNSLRLKWGDGKNLDLKNYTLELESPQSKRFIPVYQGTGHTFKVTKLQEMTSYNFRIYASNEEGDGPSSDVFTFTTQRALPPAVKAPKVTSITENSCFVEWSPAKPIGDDMLSYKLQLGTKESDFHVFYTGIQTGFTVHNLVPGTEYSVRVAAVRHCGDGELPGPFSPCTVFCTISKASPEAHAPRMSTLVSTFKNREPLTDQQWAVIILCAFTFIAICVAIIIQQVLSYTTS